MTTATLITTVVSVIALVYIITLYNGLVTLKHQCKKTLANIDVLLKQRHDELPKLVEVCKRYMDFEQATLTQIIEARSRAVQAQESHNIGENDGKKSTSRRHTYIILKQSLVINEISQVSTVITSSPTRRHKDLCKNCQ